MTGLKIMLPQILTTLLVKFLLTTSAIKPIPVFKASFAYRAKLVVKVFMPAAVPYDRLFANALPFDAPAPLHAPAMPPSTNADTILYLVFSLERY